jgi:hypothetical protein
MTTFNIEGFEVTLKPIVTTLDESLRYAVYRKLIRVCKESGDETLQLLAEDGVALLNYVTTISGIEHSSLGLPPIGTLDSGRLLEGFQKWLTIPSRVNEKILQAVNENDYPDTEDVALPGERLSAEKKPK